MVKFGVFFALAILFSFNTTFAASTNATLYTPGCAVSATTTAPNQKVIFTPTSPTIGGSFSYKWIGEASTTSTGPISVSFIFPGKYSISLSAIGTNGVGYGALCPEISVVNATTSFANTGAFYPYPFISSTTKALIPHEEQPKLEGCFNLVQNLSFGYEDDVTVPKDGVIYKLQEYLGRMGYLKVNPTGYFGPITLASVKAFQLDNDVEPTGFVGPITRGVMKRLSCSV